MRLLLHADEVGLEFERPPVTGDSVVEPSLIAKDVAAGIQRLWEIRI